MSREVNISIHTIPTDSYTIPYFDPPLNSLSQLNISLFDDSSTPATPAGTYKCKLEFIVETKDKLRVY